MTIMTIPSFHGRLAFCSNFYWCPVTLDGWTYPTAEHAYQARKMATKEDHDRVAGAWKPGHAKHMTRGLPARKNWYRIKHFVMRRVLEAKFSDTKLATMLLATGTEELVENNTWGDTYWGVYNGVGENHLGKLLMAIREELQITQKRRKK